MKTVPLSVIAKRAHITPRLARSRLRRAAQSKKVPRSVHTFRGEFKPSDVPAIKNYISD